MKLLGINFTKISAERMNVPSKDLKINTDISVKDIKKQNLGFVKEENILSFELTMTINYEKDFAKIAFSGIVLAIFDESNAKVILDSWKDEKLAETVKVPLFNFFMSKCMPRALKFEEEFNLPYHIRVPKLMLKKQDAKEAGDDKTKDKK